jgi:broad specificity phosphatase PhoE
MRLIITRHGETEENKLDIIQGQLPGTLSDLGKEQAEKLAERLSEEKMDVILSSDLARALDTAKTIAKFHKGVPLEEKEILRERYLGKFQGKTKADFKIPAENPIDDYVTKEIGESHEEFMERARKIIEMIGKRPEKKILIVCHNGIGRTIIGTLLGKTMEEINKIELGNTSISIFEGEIGDLKLKLLDSTEHLK